MSGKLNVLVTGATGKQGGHLVRALLGRGHSIRALTRKPESAGAAALAARGVTIVTGDFEDQGSLERAARGVDTVFAMSTPFERGAQTETREGINIVRAASAAGVGVSHLVYSSVAGADRATGIPHFDSKFEVEKEIRRSGVPFTIVAPVFFMENFLADWLAAGIAKGSIAMALPATRRLQQIAVADIAQFTALVIERRESFLGKRIDIASDELTVATAAAAISEASGQHIEYTALPIDAVRQWNDDLARMFEWFARVGYDADVVGLRWLYPEVDWHRFSNWAREQDWSTIAIPATPV
ncbi:MAG: NmrA/HSCARG family protein [Chloroflexi bacterium]|nr:MAG: NmrA/HSCARG family protein [Chloroflexota bacterium]